MAENGRRVLVIGLDCADPELVFERWRNDLPNLNILMSRGSYGRLESTDPPITVPAWSSMLSSRDPGQLGFYGFRNRANYSYDQLRIANSTAVQAPRVWDILATSGKRCILVGVPQTYPVPEVNGYLISDFLTPPNPRQWTYPQSLADEITEVLNGELYEFDVKDFRTEDKARLLDSTYRMTRKRWEVLQYLIERKPWDFFMFVEMGIDRLHHGFWKYMDHDHFLYEPGNRFENAIHDYYVYIDDQIGNLLTKVGDETVVIVVSDHGAQRMDGGFCVNEWLNGQGYLALEEQPKGIVKLNECKIDWSRTKAWGDGGYYARIFMNVAGREPQGVIPAEEYEAERDLLKAKLEDTRGPDGQCIGTIVLKPEEIYREVSGVAPDLIVYFGGLRWRSVGSLGHGTVHTRENDIGPDDANHSKYGVVIIYESQTPMNGFELRGVHLEQIGPTILDLLGVEIPGTMMATPITNRSYAPGANSSEVDGKVSNKSIDETGYSAEEEASITEHLGALGYI